MASGWFVDRRVAGGFRLASWMISAHISSFSPDREEYEQIQQQLRAKRVEEERRREAERRSVH
jgi:hypothetical protein